jgi:heme oxygenase
VGKKELNRVESLSQDLSYYFGENWKEEIQPSPSAALYVERIHALAKESPELLVGHHYTRYMGDLSGGQILKNIAQKAMNMDGDDGLRFYIFDDIADEKGSKRCTAPRWMRCPSIKRWRIGSLRKPTTLSTST